MDAKSRANANFEQPIDTAAVGDVPATVKTVHTDANIQGSTVTYETQPDPAASAHTVVDGEQQTLGPVGGSREDLERSVHSPTSRVAHVHNEHTGASVQLDSRSARPLEADGQAQANVTTFAATATAKGGTTVDYDNTGPSPEPLRAPVLNVQGGVDVTAHDQPQPV